MERAKAMFDPTEPVAHGNEQPLTRQQKRLLRQKKAKLYKRTAVPESSLSEAAEDYALQLAYEQHLHELQQHHGVPCSADTQQEQAQQEQPGHSKELNRREWQAGQQQQQQGQHSGGGSGKRRQQRRGFTGAALARAADSVDTLTSSSGFAVPAAQPAQQLAQISVLSGGAYTQQQQQQQQQGGTPRHIPAAPGGSGAPIPGCLATRSCDISSLLQQDWSVPAALLGQALMQQQEVKVVEDAGAKTAGVCRLDLSAAALLIGNQLAPGALLTPVQLHLVDAAAEEDAGVAEVEEATEATAMAGGGGQPGSKQQKRRRVAVHGNYHRYYGYRFFGDQRLEDPRLAVFEPKWFARRRCLDVGCNEGLVTLALAARYHPCSMLGVDIDASLVAKACRHLREVRGSAELRARLAQRAGVPPDERREAKGAAASLAQTLFVHSDFLESDVEAASLDTITCLSVTKWVHLNRGDGGLQALFATFWQALVPGGLLVLEPQPWSSYRAAASKVPRDHEPAGSFFHRLEELRLRPALFGNHLCGKLGFRLVKRFGVEECAAGFNRPMLLLRKPM